MSPEQIQLSASSRGIVDYFFCFACDEYVWDCDHLIDDRLSAERVPARDPSQLQAFAYDGRRRELQIEFRVTAPFTHGEIPLPPPPRIIQYEGVPRYVFTKLVSLKTSRRQERFWEDTIRRQYRCQTVRTVCRLPRIWRITEARNVRFSTFENYVRRLASEEREALQFVVASMKVLLLRVLSPKRIAGLGGLLECGGCGSIGATLDRIRHRNCVWSALFSSAKNGRFRWSTELKRPLH